MSVYMRGREEGATLKEIYAAVDRELGGVPKSSMREYLTETVLTSSPSAKRTSPDGRAH